MSQTVTCNFGQFLVYHFFVIIIALVFVFKLVQVALDIDYHHNLLLSR